MHHVLTTRTEKMTLPEPGLKNDQSLLLALTEVMIKE